MMRLHTLRQRRRRGTIIVMVMAVLALLAVIGTVYIVSSRAERSSATAAITAVNLDLAQEAVDKMAVGVIGSAIHDGNGTLGGYANIGPLGVLQSRRWDMPEINPTLDPTWIGRADYNTGYRDQTWLATGLYVPSAGLNIPAKADGTHVRYNVMSLLTSAGFNPSTGAYDLVFYVPGSGQIAAPGMGYFDVVAPNLAATTPVPLPQGGSVAAAPDAFIQLLPFSEGSGIRYRFGVRILDSSSMANINVGMTYNSALPTADQMSGTYFTGYNLSTGNLGVLRMFRIDTPFGLAVDDPLRLLTARFGAWTVPPSPPWLTPDFYWAQMALRFENAATERLQFAPFDISDELGLRSYGALGTLFTPRAATAFGSPVWPNTLGNRNPNSLDIQINHHRSFYTAYSYARDLRPLADPDPPFTLLPEGGWIIPPPHPTLIWPPFPAKVAAAPDVEYLTNDAPPLAADILAIAATNIARAMEYCGYSPQESRSLGANYLTYRLNGWAPVNPPPSGATGPVYTLVAGPSFVDDAGPCLRSAVVSRNYQSTNFKSEVGGKVYLGYAAQPFLNEIAQTQTETPAGVKTVTDSAIELYNPYNVALSLDDYQLKLGTTTIALTGEFVPARGYFVLAMTGGGLSSSTATTARKKELASLSLEGVTKVLLLRRYITRGGAVAHGAVDQYDISQMASIPPAGSAGQTTYYVRRCNEDPPAEAGNPDYLNRWIAVVATDFSRESQVTPGTAPEEMTLGKANPKVSDLPPFPLHHRFDLPGVPAAPPLANIVEFNRIPRICNGISTGTGGEPLDNAMIPHQLWVLHEDADTDPLVKDTDLPIQAQIHFDFRAVPAIYTSAGQPTIPNGYGDVPKRGDPRAVRLLDCLTFVDRVSDYAIDLGDNNPVQRGVSKLRIPGQINVNTASPQVLASIPALAANPQYIGLLMAYRWRTRTDDGRIPPAIQYAPVIDFGNATQFPGYGIRSMAELQVPFHVLDLVSATTRKTLEERDRFWGNLYNYLTVRSDTFVMYAYLEAVRQNPLYSGGFNNASDWYLSNAVAVTDNPGDATKPLLRVGRKRWVALIDRSFGNANRLWYDATIPAMVPNPEYSEPRIVARKDLPQ